MYGGVLPVIEEEMCPFTEYALKIAPRGEDKNDLNTEERALKTAFVVVAASTLETCFVPSLLKKYIPSDLTSQTYSFLCALT